MVTDDDIVRMLDGEPSRAQEAPDARVVEGLNGRATAENQALNDRITETLDGRSENVSDFKTTQEWAAKATADAAVKTLSEKIMRANPSKGIYAAEAEAKQIAETAYKGAAKATTNESSRQNAVVEIVNLHAKHVKATANGN